MSIINKMRFALALIPVPNATKPSSAFNISGETSLSKAGISKGVEKYTLRLVNCGG